MSMPLQLLSGPASEPLTLAEAKAYLKVDHADEDTLIASLITAARIHVEVALSHALISQSWSLFLDAWSEDGNVELPIVPLQTIDLVQVFDADDGATVIAASDYHVDTVSMPGRFTLKAGGVSVQPGRPVNGVEIRFTSGYGASAVDVPEAIRQALLMLVAHWFERREPVVLGETAVQIPNTAMSLLLPYKQVRL